MEKTKNKKVEELFKSIQESWDDTHTFFYRIGGDRTNVVPIEIYNNIAIADIKALVDYIAPISYDSGYDMVIEQSLIAKFFLDSFTDLPVPTTKIDNKESTDYNLCYEIVFGNNGIVAFDRMSKENIELIISFIHARRESLIASERAAQKLLDLYEILKQEVSDINNNPARQAELVEYLDGLFKSDNILNGDFNG